MGHAKLVQQLEDVLRTTALSAMAVYEQGIHQTQDQLHTCMEDLHQVREAADAQCLAQVQQIQLQYQQDLDALTAQYEEQVRCLEQQTRQRITEAHAEAEEVITQAAAELLSKLQPPTPAAAAATQELSMLQLQHADQSQGLGSDAHQAWEEQQQQQQRSFDLQHFHEPTSANGMPACASGNVSRIPSSIAVAATSLASNPQPEYTNAAAGNDCQQQEPQQLRVQQHLLNQQHTASHAATMQQPPPQLEQLHVQPGEIGSPEWQQQQQQLLEDQSLIDSSYSMHHKQQQDSGSGLRRHTSSRSNTSSSRLHAAALQQELTDMPPPANRGRASSRCPGWAEPQQNSVERAMERSSSRRHTSGDRRASGYEQAAASPAGSSMLEHQQGWHAPHNTPSQARHSSSGVFSAAHVGRSSRSSRSEQGAAGSRRSSKADAAARSSSLHYAARAAAMAAAAVADDDDDDDDYQSTEWSAHAQHAAQAQLHQQHVPAMSAADVLRRSSSSRQQLSNSLVQGLRRASSEAASASAAAAEGRRSDGSSGSGPSALDVAGGRDSGSYLRSTSSARKQERHSSRARGRSDSKHVTQLFASWQPGSASKHMDSSILKALMPAGSHPSSRHQRQDQAAAAAAAPRSDTWAMVNSPIHSAVKDGARQRRPSRALDLLQDDDSGSDA